MTDTELVDEDIPDVPQWVIHIVVATRLGLGIFLSVGILYLVTAFSSISFLPPLTDPLLSIALIKWFVVVALIEIGVIVVSFKFLMVASWMVASLFYKPLRDSLRAELDKDEPNETA